MAMFEDYAPYYMREGEEFNPYLARLRAERKGGILGGLSSWNTSGSDESSLADEALGQLIKKRVADVSGATDSSPVYDPYTGSDWELGGYSRKDQQIGDAVDRLTGRQYAGQGLFYGLANTLSNWSDRSAIESHLKKQGWTQYEIDRYLANPENLKAVQSLDRLGVMSKDPYDYKDQNTEDSLLDVARRMFGGMPEYSRQSPMRTSDQFDMPLVTPQAGDIANILAAQQRTPYNPFAELTTGLFDGPLKNPKAVASAQAAVERERQAEAARQAAIAEANRRAAAAEAARGYDSSGNYDWSQGAPSYSNSSSTGGDWAMNSSGTGYTTSSGQSVSFDLSRD